MVFICLSRACAFTKAPTYHPCSSAREWDQFRTLQSLDILCTARCRTVLVGFLILPVYPGQLWHLSKEGSPEDTMEVRRVMCRLCALYNSSPTLKSAEAVRFFSHMGKTVVRAVDAALPAQPALRVGDWLLFHHRLVCVQSGPVCLFTVMLYWWGSCVAFGSCNQECMSIVR
jgi:hypothetical protein